MNLVIERMEIVELGKEYGGAITKNITIDVFKVEKVKIDMADIHEGATIKYVNLGETDEEVKTIQMNEKFGEFNDKKAAWPIKFVNKVTVDGVEVYNKRYYYTYKKEMENGEVVNIVE